MLGLFTSRDYTHQGEVQHPNFDYVRRTYLRELANVVDFYHNRIYATKSDHFLVKLLYLIDVPLSYPTERFLDVTAIRAPFISRAMRMTSEINAGSVFEGEFFGPGTKELIISNDDYFDPVLTEREWKRICAVTVISHPKSDLGLLLANGKKASTGDGLAVISVNIPLLALQFKCFLQEQKIFVRANQDVNSLNFSHFVYMYVLPNMLYSQFDLTLLNRAMNLYYGLEMGIGLVRHPFMVTNYARKVDESLAFALERSLSTRDRFEKSINLFPTVVNQDMLEALVLPEIAPTRQVYWALTLSRLRVVKFFLDLNQENGSGANRNWINQFQRTLIRLRHENIYPSVLSGELLIDTEKTIDEILAL